MISPSGITEVASARGESVGENRRPVEQIYGSLDHDGEIRRPGDPEAKPVCSHTEARAKVQDHRIWEEPGGCREAAKGRAPTRGAGQVINGRKVVIAERRQADGGGVTGEVDTCQVTSALGKAPPA